VAGSIRTAVGEAEDVRFSAKATGLIAWADLSHDRPSRALGLGVDRDAWLARNVRVVVASEPALTTARAFAIAAHPSLATIYALDETRGVVYVEAEPARADPEVPSGEDVRRLDEALRALHRAGATHGAVDIAHLFRRGGAIALAYPSKPGSGTAASDLAALEALERRA
jgi:hypothetical protein